MTAPDEVLLRDVTEADLPVLFEHQDDPEANRMAAFPARDREAFMTHWRTKVLADRTAVKKAVLYRGDLAGSVLCFEQAGKRLVGYWIGREFWGRGIATAALHGLLRTVRERPIHAFVAAHNAGSIRVLEKCGFVRCGAELDPAAEGPAPVAELLFQLTE